MKTGMGLSNLFQERNKGLGRFLAAPGEEGVSVDTPSSGELAKTAQNLLQQKEDC